MARTYRPAPARRSAHELAERLGRNIETLAEELLGKPSLKGRNAWRWGSQGSFVVNLNGARRGRWYSFEEGKGGDALDLVQRQHGGDLKHAMSWARAWLGGAS